MGDFSNLHSAILIVHHWIGMFSSLFESHVPKFGHISITFLPSAILFWYIRAYQGLNRPNMAKYTWGW